MAEYKPYKMKGHTLPGINQRSEGDTDLPDGRSGSSPLQYKYPKSPAKQGLILEDKKKAKQRRESPLGPGKTVNVKDIKGLKSDKSKYSKLGPGKRKTDMKKSSPNKWMQFIPMALSAMSAMSSKKEKEE